MAARKTARAAEPEPIQTYGCRLAGQDQLFYDRYAFAFRVSIDKGAPTRPVLFKRIAEKLVPGWFEWHDWTNKVVNTLCHNQWAAFAGCASSAKTRNVAGFACTWWLAYPEQSGVIFCSTSMKSLRKRGWAEVQNYHTSIPGPRIGNFVDSEMKWQAVKGDDKHAIVGIAVEQGSMNQVADNIKGIHPRRLLIVVDEATAVPAAIFEACTNLWQTEEFLLVLMGNPRSRLDEFGKFCEPLEGWNSVGVDTEEWESTPKINGANGIVIRFDAERSPNIVEGRLVSRYLPTREKVEARKKSLGSENDPSYWSNDRGFWPPEGMTKTVFSETAIVKHDGYGKHKFTGNNFHIIGTLDPARVGGDRPTLRFAALGETEGGKWGIELMPPILISLNARSTNPVDFQLAEQVQRECENVKWRGQKYSCPPENFGVDATGGGADLCDIFQRVWSPDIIRIQFGGSSSEDACSKEDIRPANKVYRNKRAEMHFRARNCLNADQLKGIDTETAKELCSIEFDDSKPLIVMMDKKDYKKKYGKSPDLGDSAIMTLEVARKKGFRLAPVGHTVTRTGSFDKEVEKAMAVFESVDYSEEEFHELAEAF
jgi:hypothetical protein